MVDNTAVHGSPTNALAFFAVACHVVSARKVKFDYLVGRSNDLWFCKLIFVFIDQELVLPGRSHAVVEGHRGSVPRLVRADHVQPHVVLLARVRSCQVELSVHCLQLDIESS